MTELILKMIQPAMAMETDEVGSLHASNKETQGMKEHVARAFYYIRQKS